ncbi:hypothetical protein [Erysipelothrix aquatica]|uniref:hypothetical protein n=1 Tax=Erysipelothrix aquatica TaxID=2683714 RepID=UPI001F28C390|nr:hypothetical protein [Erysipelothrix aquatica]
MGRNTALSKTYSDDEYYTSQEIIEKFIDKVVKLSQILKHKTIAMPFTKRDSPLGIEMSKYHQNVLYFEGDKTLWESVEEYEDVSVIDNSPFSLSSKIEKYYIEKSTPFILFRSTVSFLNLFLEKRKQVLSTYRDGIAVTLYKSLKGKGLIS